MSQTELDLMEDLLLERLSLLGCLDRSGERKKKQSNEDNL